LTFGGGLTAAKKALRKSDKLGKGPAAKKGGIAEKGDAGKKPAKKRGGSKASGASGQEKGGAEDAEPTYKRRRKKGTVAADADEQALQEVEKQLGGRCGGKCKETDREEGKEEGRVDRGGDREECRGCGVRGGRGNRPGGNESWGGVDKGGEEHELHHCYEEAEEDRRQHHEHDSGKTNC
jgi:hypothetical protein